jgi:hypothetical protein
LTPADSPPPPELQAIEAELARKHWDAWLDTKVPALGNRTPRQAAKTASGRERLEALLADYSQSVSARDAFEPDIGTLKRKLWSVRVVAMPFEDDRASRLRTGHNELGLQGAAPHPSTRLD